MVEVYKQLPNADRLAAWLESIIRPSLKPDVSNYAKGRLRTWLNVEPMLFAPFDVKPAFEVSEAITNRLKELIEWDFDFCLVTYSGDETPVGIGPHMDAGYADFEARSIHVSGECRFDYWMTRPSFGRGPIINPFNLDRTDYAVKVAGKPADPSHSLVLEPGMVTRFNCKSPHAATPGVKRWNLNFWRRSQKAKV